MISFACGDYTVSASIGVIPNIYGSYVEHAILHDDLGLSGVDGTQLIVLAERTSSNWPELVSAQRFSPGPDAAFYPGLILIAETHLLLVGAGTRLLAYDLAAPRRLWQDEAEMGFWAWKRHGNVVIMSAELELAAWSIRGRKLWTTFVEPPWDYQVIHGKIQLDVMGQTSIFELETGPHPRAAGEQCDE